MTPVDQFFAFARERHSIYLRRLRGDPWPWTQDLVLQAGRFTNVFRELDRTTDWFRRNVRDPMRDQPEVLLATLVFRWFNRTTTGEAIFCQPDLFDGKTAFEVALEQSRPHNSTFMGFTKNTKFVAVLREAIYKQVPKGPYVTGAYTINTRSAGLGLTKLDGVLRLIEMWLERHPDWRDVAVSLVSGERLGDHDGYFGSMEEFCRWATSPCLAGFMTYEVACDLRHTGILERAPDVLTWANPGPGAVRGLNRIHDRPVGRGLRPEPAIAEMVGLLEASRSSDYWPQMRNGLYMLTGPATRWGLARMGLQNYNSRAPAWPAWELREVEHTLCEFDKYQRVSAGQGQTRGRFRRPS